ncbi:hypothetical protein HOB10_02540 [Candidatus Parcubacteria bacterium]|jgi:hypothetical protein|nr:hypothetical protein [Candidatus Parcubacteria bacterium]
MLYAIERDPATGKKIVVGMFNRRRVPSEEEAWILASTQTKSASEKPKNEQHTKALILSENIKSPRI